MEVPAMECILECSRDIVPSRAPFDAVATLIKASRAEQRKERRQPWDPARCRT